MKILMLVLVMMIFLIAGCTTIPTKPVSKRSQEIHYNQSGQFTGRTYIREYKNGSIVQEHYNSSGQYVGTSRSK